ncbi:leucine-rich repeat domain-containing protein [Gimesia algae]|uniref:Leucine Rich repeats (2 copies) n=1 Tax=Gimesia algae TaxID=2527971 RepID=A0A517VCZ6_9PLAN|nr:hypothetical protein [Gimesia algae]QDT89945.1 hypothetical protein Pan161_15780 [Gimesia algae]QDT90878.1 hypothetical protein Pan161_25320 [Gimesia algae]
MKLKHKPKTLAILCVLFSLVLLVFTFSSSMFSYLKRVRVVENLTSLYSMGAVEEEGSDSLPRHYLVYTPKTGLLSRLKIMSPIGMADTVSQISYDIESSEKALPESIDTFTEVQSLTLSNISLTSREALIIGKLNNISSITFYNCDLSIQFCSNFPSKNKLSEIRIYESTASPSSMSALLRRTPDLSTLSISKNNQTSELLKNAQALPLESLSLRRCSIDQESLLLISKIQTLKHLDLRDNKLPTRSFEFLATLPKIWGIDIRKTTFSPNELADLSTSESLTAIWISGQKITTNDLNSLFKIRTLQQITAVLPTKEPHPKSHKDVKVIIRRYDYDTANE